ncbi:unnamed protein product [Nippostrongylus brasiliensis]|uniref:Defective in cullin neddylation protein n=1 Tax=Nippostrongylus brasiliensis TaxID=27835 RepID=A0A0N4YZW7_NIPBR|nr:unnamed protein product [Nippostrongylus brasiliensis]
MFSVYANDPRDDVGSGRIGPNGMLRLLNDLHLDPADRRVLILACKLKVGLLELFEFQCHHVVIFFVYLCVAL